AAQFLIRKLYAWLIAEAPAPPDSLLEPLAERFRQSDYDIGDIVGTILRSRHFFSEFAYRQRVKSPVEYAIGVVRAVRPNAAPRELVGPLEAMGQSLFAPPNVKGWPGGRAWLNSATVLARQNFAQVMTAGPNAPPGPSNITAGIAAAVGSSATPPVSGTLVLAAADAVTPQPQLPEAVDGIVAVVEQEKATEPAVAVNVLADLLLQGDIAEETRSKLTAFLAGGKPAKAVWQQRVREMTHALLTLPEYTLA
ncbi:MAG TPA: DUF1800 family protein, partial [Gemmataceae bacterium]|nr:DUF1800 family protein [Gemmataceae bacterium]